MAIDQPNSEDNIVERNLRDMRAEAIAAKNSSEVSDILEILADGRVRIIGDIGHEDQVRSTAQRTEIDMGPKTQVDFHKNPLNQGNDMFAIAVRASKIEVKAGERSASLDIAIDNRGTSQHNPYYVFRDQGTQLAGLGYGQHMDITLATALTGISLEKANSSKIPASVIDWVKEKVRELTT